MAARDDGKGDDTPRGTSRILPVIEEQLRVDKRQVETGRLRISREVHEHVEHVDVPLLTEEFEVERIPRGEVVAASPGIRQEGDTTIIPVLEEELVLQKRLVLREEIRVTRRRSERRFETDVPLRRQEVRVERKQPTDENTPPAS